jgi:hypothetical protein
MYVKKPSKRTEISPYNVDNSIHHLAFFVALSTERIPLFALRLTQLGLGTYSYVCKFVDDITEKGWDLMNSAENLSWLASPTT